MILVIFNNSSLNSLYEVKEILKNDRGLHPAILVRNKVDTISKKDLSVKKLTNKYRCTYFELSAINSEQVTKLFIIIIRLIERRTTISSDSNAIECSDQNRIRVIITFKQKVE
jgi:50S ribosomal subunit-associated GTPase HflX